MSSVKIAYPLLLLALLAPATASAQIPPPDERAAAQALADVAKRVVEVAEHVDEDPAWLEDCKAMLGPEPPWRYAERASAVRDGLVIRDLIDDLKPAMLQARSDLANTQTADPVLISGRAAVRQILRAVGAFPAPEADPCGAYEAYVRAGYPPGPAREARAWDRQLSTLANRQKKRKILAAGDRMEALGVSRADADAFRQLSD